MKKLSFLMAALLVAMTGCQKEPQVTESTADGKVYMSFTVSFPETKSQTDGTGTGDSNSNADEDTEVGQDFENQVSSIDVLLYDSAAGEYVKASNVNKVGAGTSYTATFTNGAIKNSTDYEVYVIINGTCNEIDATYADLSTVNLTNSIAKDNNFLMTNANEANTKTTPANWNDYSKTNPFPLGDVEVERAVARFDYAAHNTDNKYNMTPTDGEIVIQLTKAAVINMNKSFYYFRRVSDTGLPSGGNFSVGGDETPENYVIDPDYAIKNTAKDDYATSSANYMARFVDHMTEGVDGWTWTELSSLTGNDDSWTDNMTTGHEYKRWTYVTENTTPGVVDNQINGISTGVVFLGEVTGTSALLNGVTEDVYVLNNNLVGTWDTIKNAVDNETASAELAAAYAAVPASSPTKADFENAGFKCIKYNTTTNKHEVLYYYWNRHNDNNQKATMGKMEFAVVRNNVYKLAVTNIKNYGHPTDPSYPDPDPVDPTNPDESAEYYFTVSVKVLPWTVRVNDIEF